MRPGDSTPNEGVAILVVVTVILLVMALVLALAHRPPVVKENESPEPALDSVERQSSSHEAPAPPVQREP
jgi:hypothetical protein